MQNFTFTGPLGPIECLVEPNRSNKKQVLIMSHGFRGSRESGGKAAGVAQILASCCDVVRYNFTGTRILSLQVAELRAVIAAVRQQSPEASIYLLGRSMGGAASIIAASQEQNIKGLVLWSAPNNMRETFRHVMTDQYYDYVNAGNTLSFTDERGDCELTPDFLTDFDNYDLPQLLAGLGCPVLMLHCQGDETVLVDQARRNAAVLGAKGTLKEYPNGDHSMGEYSEAASQYILEWLERW